MEIYKIQLRDYREYLVVGNNPTDAVTSLQTYLSNKGYDYLSGRETKIIEIVGVNVSNDDRFENIFDMRNFRT